MSEGPKPRYPHPLDPRLGLEDGLMGVYSILQTVQSDLSQHAMQLSQLHRDIEEATRSLESLNRVIHTGNGGKSLMVRVELIEQAILRTAEGITEIRRSLETINLEGSRGRWGLAQTVVTVIGGIIAALLTALLTALIRQGGKP